MTQPLNNLTQAKAAIEAATATGAEIRAWSGKLKGFMLRAFSTGTGTYIYRYTWNGRTASIKVARYGEVSFKKASDIAMAYATEVAKGIDPRAAKKAAKVQAKADANTVQVAGARWLKQYKATKSHGSFRSADSAMRSHIVPALGSMAVASVTSDDIRQMLAKVKTAGAARSAYAYARIFFEWAYGEGLTDGNPVAAMPKAKRPPIPKARSRHLAPDEIQAFWQATAGEDVGWRSMFRLILATGARLSEAAQLDWAELDRVDRHWLLPEGRAKNDVAHLIHLSQPAVDALDALAGTKWPTSGAVFSENSANGHHKRALARIQGSMQAELPKMAPWSVHDLRRTFATVAGDMGEAKEVIELALNHKSGASGLVQTYQRSERMMERKALFEILGEALLAMAAGKRAGDFRNAYGETDEGAFKQYCEVQRERWRIEWGKQANGTSHAGQKVVQLHEGKS